MEEMVLNSSETQCQALTSCAWPFDSQVGKRQHRRNITLQLLTLITLKHSSGLCLYEVMCRFNACNRDFLYSFQSQARCCNQITIIVQCCNWRKSRQGKTYCLKHSCWINSTFTCLKATKNTLSINKPKQYSIYNGLIE